MSENKFNNKREQNTKIYIDRDEVLRILEEFSLRPTKTVIPVIRGLNTFTEDTITASKCTTSYMCKNCENIFSSKQPDVCYFCGSTEFIPYHFDEGESKDGGEDKT